METRLCPATDDAIADAVRLLQSGELVAVPTETVYGLAAHAFLPEAVLSVFAAKERPSFDPLIAHVLPTELDALCEVVDLSRLKTAARQRATALTTLWPGPLTLVLPKGEKIPDHATSGFDTVAVRSPSHPVMRALLRGLGAPVVAPSANRFGRISPTRASHVADELSGRIPLILDGGPTDHGIESTIVGVEDDGTLRLLRPGSLPVEEIKKVAGAPLRAAEGPARAPGMLASHYAPRIPLVCAPSAEETDGPVAWLVFDSDAPPDAARFGKPVAIERLGSDDRRAAQHLFAALRRLDGSGAAWILAETPREQGGLWPALRDRLARAAATR